jgi:hypothetical protein
MSSAAAGPLAEDLSPAEAVGVLRSLVANVPGAIVRADGAVRWVLERGTTALDEQGRVCLDGVILVDRLGAVGGRLQVESPPPGGGTTVRAIVPRDPGT